MIKLCGAGVIHPGLGFGGQECLRHNFFSLDSTVELPERTDINNHPIDLVGNKPPPCDLSNHPPALRP